MEQIYKKEIKKNTLIFGIGEICTKVLQYFVAFSLSYFLSKNQTGDIALLKTSASIIIPIISLDIIEAVFRFSAEKNENKKSVFTIGIIICFVAFLLLIPVCFFIDYFFDITSYFIVYFYISTLMLHNIIHYFVKGIGKTVIYSFNSLLYAIGTCAVTLLILFLFHGGVSTYFICYIGTHVFCIFFMFVSCKLWNYFSIKSISFKKIKLMLAYSVPLIFTTIGWWLISASDTYITNYFLGSSAVGILSYSHKFPAILSSFFTIFGMSVQLLAVSKFDISRKCDKEKVENIFNEIINKTIFLLCGIVLMISLFAQPIIKLFVHHEYFSSWQFVSLYTCGMFFSLISTIYGYVFNLAKKSMPLLISTLICGLSNIFLCIILYKIMHSLYAAAISTFISYLFIFFYRHLKIKKIITIRFEKRYLLCFLFIFISCILNSIYNFEIRTLLSINSMVLLSYIVTYMHDIGRMLKTFKNI